MNRIPLSHISHSLYTDHLVSHHGHVHQPIELIEYYPSTPRTRPPITPHLYDPGRIQVIVCPEVGVSFVDESWEHQHITGSRTFFLSPHTRLKDLERHILTKSWLCPSSVFALHVPLAHVPHSITNNTTLWRFGRRVRIVELNSTNFGDMQSHIDADETLHGTYKLLRYHTRRPVRDDTIYLRTGVCIPFAPPASRQRMWDRLSLHHLLCHHLDFPNRRGLFIDGPLPEQIPLTTNLSWSPPLHAPHLSFTQRRPYIATPSKEHTLTHFSVWPVIKITFVKSNNCVLESRDFDARIPFKQILVWLQINFFTAGFWWLFLAEDKFDIAQLKGCVGHRHATHAKHYRCVLSYSAA